ncbi:MAG: hypothetical protein R2912_05875 [Eubacteriales bacterium]
MVGRIYRDASALPQYWFLGIGALGNTLMFLFISIPMAEKRLAGYKEGFKAYQAETNRLLPVRLRAGALNNEIHMTKNRPINWAVLCETGRKTGGVGKTGIVSS